MTDTRHRHILHIDMNAFYCACHAAEQPTLYAGRPTAVAGSPETRHGIVVTASYEARARGVKATMTVAQALRKCPKLILIAPDFDLYRTYSREVFHIVGNYTPIVEICSIDECFADISGSLQFGTPGAIARRIQAQILEQLGLPCSVGIGPNKFLAKMASDMKKPRGITQLAGEQIETMLWPLPVGAMYGVGEQTAKRLQLMNVQTIGNLAKCPVEKLIRAFGVRGSELHAHANGQDENPVKAQRDPLKSVGHSVTLPEDATSLAQMQPVLLNLADQVGRRLRKHQLQGRTITLTMRDKSLRTWSRSTTLPRATDITETIYQQAMALTRGQLRKGLAIRLLGITVSQLTTAGDAGPEVVQLSLFPETDEPLAVSRAAQEQRLRQIDKVSDELRNRFGENIVIRGSMLLPHESNQLRDRKIRGTSLQKDNLLEE